ncbi:hypothetical protein [Acinetobacter gyllenbergii]|uniref:hypothetical protein n=1 Tax=Acinetobacter gyllenbergii TaxID=134534 RepID=UPI003F56ABC5
MTNRTLGNQSNQSQLSIKSLFVGILIAVILFAMIYFLALRKTDTGSQASTQQHAVSAESKDYSKELHASMARLGTISEVNKIQGNLLAWTIMINGSPQVVFTTSDEKVVITGNAFDVNTMDSVSLPLLQAAQQKYGNGTSENPSGLGTPLGQGQVTVDFAEIVGEWNKPVPAAIEVLAKLKGAKEGKGSDTDTLYVLYDPRCPNCHEAYRATRKYVEKGYSIKWIPTVLLKQSDDGYTLAAATLHDPSLLNKAFSKDTTGLPAATAEDKKAIDENQAFLVQATQQSTNSNTIAVPTAFYLNKKTGQPKMATGLSDASILEMIFGKI